MGFRSGKDCRRNSKRLSIQCQLTAVTAMVIHVQQDLLEKNGANSINPVRDIQLQMLSAMRQSVDIPIDIHTENPASTGGFIRHYEVPEMIRVAAPVYLKTGGSVAKTTVDSSEVDARARAKQVMLVKRMIDSYYFDTLASPKKTKL